MTRWLRNYFGKPVWMIFFGAAYLVSQMIIARILAPIGTDTFLKLQLCFSREFYLDTFQAWRASGQMAAYRTHFFVDMFHPLWYALFLVSMLACVLNRKRVSDRWNWILILPFFAAGFDWLENIVQIMFLSGVPVSSALVLASSTFSLLKWIVAFGSLSLVFLILFL